MNLMKGQRSPKVGNKPRTLVSDHAEAKPLPIPSVKPSSSINNKLPVVHMKTAFYEGFEKSASIGGAIGSTINTGRNIFQAGKGLIKDYTGHARNLGHSVSRNLKRGINDFRINATRGSRDIARAERLKAKELAADQVNQTIAENAVNKTKRIADQKAEGALLRKQKEEAALKAAKNAKRNPGDAAAAAQSKIDINKQTITPQPSFMNQHYGKILGGSMVGAGGLGYMAGREKTAFLSGFVRGATNLVGRSGASLGQMGKKMVAENAKDTFKHTLGKGMQNAGGFVAKNKKAVTLGLGAAGSMGAGYGLAKATNSGNGGNNVQVYN